MVTRAPDRLDQPLFSASGDLERAGGEVGSGVREGRFRESKTQTVRTGAAGIHDCILARQQAAIEGARLAAISNLQTEWARDVSEPARLDQGIYSLPRTRKFDKSDARRAAEWQLAIGSRCLGQPDGSSLLGLFAWAVARFFDRLRGGGSLGSAASSLIRTQGRKCSSVFGPIPFTRRRSSTDWNGPFSSRSATIRRASPSPMPLIWPHSTQVAELASMRNSSCRAGSRSI